METHLIFVQNVFIFNVEFVEWFIVKTHAQSKRKSFIQANIQKEISVFDLSMH